MAINHPASLSGFGAGVTRLGDGVRLMAVAAPLTPRPRGTIYEALPCVWIVEEFPDAIPDRRIKIKGPISVSLVLCDLKMVICKHLTINRSI